MPAPFMPLLRMERIGESMISVADLRIDHALRAARPRRRRDGSWDADGRQIQTLEHEVAAGGLRLSLRWLCRPAKVLSDGPVLRLESTGVPLPSFPGPSRLPARDVLSAW